MPLCPHLTQLVIITYLHTRITYYVCRTIFARIKRITIKKNRVHYTYSKQNHTVNLTRHLIFNNFTGLMKEFSDQFYP